MSAINEMWVHYRMNKKTIAFWCAGGSDTDRIPVDAELSKFLHDFSKGKKVFLNAFMLEDEKKLPKIVDTDSILEKAEMILDPMHIFLNLRDAKVDTNYFHCAYSISIYFFDEKVRWTDFLPVSTEISRKYIEKEMLLARFDSDDHGADFYFECCRDYEESVTALLRTLSDLGCIVKQVPHLLID